MTDLEKDIKVTPKVHKKLQRAKLEMYGAESARFSDVIEALTDQVLNEGETDE
ncbi:hypothetical protein [Halostagnicola kamekurae]|uniref:Uncharacterized protein n=1 Tax=Halostagnicola kamekurae TaxID=619731 RepID=A0A1I6QUP1_9EURY|nr:hypothetical protein [Halostagnicola kamekurae]SFS56247.1 hypothetical protein SAMN04488556_1590 [Halostagnicola kamekurae]